MFARWGLRKTSTDLSYDCHALFSLSSFSVPYLPSIRNLLLALGNAQASPKRVARNRRRDFFARARDANSLKFQRINGTEPSSHLGDIDCGPRHTTLSARWLVINYSYRFLPSLSFSLHDSRPFVYNSRAVYACADTSRLITEEGEKQSELPARAGSMLSCRIDSQGLWLSVESRFL